MMPGADGMKSTVSTAFVIFGMVYIDLMHRSTRNIYKSILKKYQQELIYMNLIENIVDRKERGSQA